MTAQTHFSGSVPGVSNSNFIKTPAPAYLPPNQYQVGTGVEGNRSVRYIPIRLQRAYQITGIAFNVTAVGGTENTRLGLYIHDNIRGGPTRLLVDGGQVPIASTGVMEVAITPMNLPPGVYWAAISTDSNGVVATKSTTSGSSVYSSQKSAPSFVPSGGRVGPARPDNSLPPISDDTGTTGVVPRVLLKGVPL